MKIVIASQRAQLAEALQSALLGSGHRVVGTAEERSRVLPLLHATAVDVLLLDVAMLGKDTALLVREVMSERPSAVLLCAENNEQQLSHVYEAMGAGAVDVVPLSRGDGLAPNEPAVLLAKLGTIAKLRGGDDAAVPASSVRNDPFLVAFGASTGGPQALVDVLGALPREFNAAMVIVQHVDREFAHGFAGWLDSQTPFQTEIAALHTAPKPGRVVVAATNDHLVMTASRTFSYTPEPRHATYRPSVDVLFRSLARYWGKPGIAVLLTGMGRDGAEGLLALRRAGWLTIAQDEATSVVYGMPKAAAELGAASKVLPLGDIAKAIASHRQR